MYSKRIENPLATQRIGDENASGAADLKYNNNRSQKGRRHESTWIPFSVRVSNKFNPYASLLELRRIKNFVNFDETQKGATILNFQVVHQTFGMLTKLDRNSVVCSISAREGGNKKRCFKSDADNDGQLLYNLDGFNLFGTTIKNSRSILSTPEQDRRAKRRELKVLEEKLFDNELNCDADEMDSFSEGWEYVDAERMEVQKIPEGLLNEFPSWNGQIKGIESRAHELMLVEFDAISLQLMNELEKFWLLWNSKFHVNFSAEHTQLLIEKRHIFFDKRPEWQVLNTRHSTLPVIDANQLMIGNDSVEARSSEENRADDLEGENFSSLQLSLNDTFRIHLTVIADFWANFSGKLLHNWHDFFVSSETMYLQDIDNEMTAFIRDALKITKFDWPLRICSILLENSKHWIEWLTEDVKCAKFFDSIASLQENILCNVIYANIDDLMKEMSQCKLAKLFCIKVPIYGRSIDRSAAWEVFQKLFDLGKDILRCECRLYPNLFPVKTFSIAQSMVFERFHMDSIDPFYDIESKLTKLEERMLEIPQANEPTPLFVELLEAFKCLRKECMMAKTMWFSEPYEYDFTDVKEQLLRKMEQNFELLTNEITNHLYTMIKKIADYCTACTDKLHRRDQFAQMHNLMEVRDKEFGKLVEMVGVLHQCYWSIAEHFEFSEVMVHKYYQASRTPQKLSYLLNLVWQRLEVDRKNIEKSVTEKSNTMFYEGDMLERDLRSCIKKYRNTHSMLEISQLHVRFGDMTTRTARMAADYPVIKEQLSILGLDPIAIDVPALNARVSAFYELISLHKDVISCEEAHMNVKVISADTDAFNAEVKILNIKTARVKDLIQNETDEFIDESSREVLTMLVNKIDIMLSDFNNVLPVLNALCSEGMKRRQWNDLLTDASGKSIKSKEKLLVKDLVSFKLTDKVEECEEMSLLASKEMILENSLVAMKAQWDEHTMQVVKHSTTNVCSIKLSVDMMILLDEQLIKTQMSISSPYAQNLLIELREWLAKLQSLRSTLDVYHKAETKWLYLEPLFSAEDIVYQMPDEWRLFQQVIEKWSSLTQKIADTQRYIDLADLDLQKEFKEILNTFYTIQCGFDIYLQKRKLNFPRLYFLSNSELLEMLSKAKEPQAVESFLCKLFSSISRLEFNARGEICAVFAKNGERFPLARNVNVNLTKRHIDKWLMEVEREMRISVKNRLKSLIRAYRLDFPENLMDVLNDEKFSSQTVLLYYKICATHIIEMAISNQHLGETKAKFVQLLESLQCAKNLSNRQDSSLEAVKSENITANDSNDHQSSRKEPITAEILNREEMKQREASKSQQRDATFHLVENLLIEMDAFCQILDHLIAGECLSPDDYEWTSNFRFYWSNDNLFIRFFNISLLYNYEYLSVEKPFILTPQVRRIHGQLIVLQHEGYAGILKGPAATGKSESIKELSKILGRFCVVFNCSQQVDRCHLENLLCGTMLSGSILCLDEFNRLPKDTMAWMANHLLGIYQAIISGTLFYHIGGLQITINPYAAFFLTMNPLFLARFSLPANVPSSIKSISVESADIRCIVSPYLLLGGLKTSRKSSKLLANVFRQSVLTLSPMQHYDFYLRAVLAAVFDAIEKKKSLDSGHRKCKDANSEANDDEVDENASAASDFYGTLKDARQELELVGQSAQNIIWPTLTRIDTEPFLRIYLSNFGQHHRVTVGEDGQTTSSQANGTADESSQSREMALVENELESKIAGVCQRIMESSLSKGLSPSLGFVRSCVNFYRLSRLHQAFILVGASLSGKSACINVVQQVLYDFNDVECEVVRINPSQYDAEALYGHFDAQRLEWNNGIIAHHLSKAAAAEAMRRQTFSADSRKQNEARHASFLREQLDKKVCRKEVWLVLDGVLDSLWVESMNSLLDNNKKLCLANGETIPLSQDVRIIFETDSLARLASSTISRCRVVYFDATTFDSSLAFAIEPGLIPGDDVELLRHTLKRSITQFRVTSPFILRLYADTVKQFFSFYKRVKVERVVDTATTRKSTTGSSSSKKKTENEQSCTTGDDKEEKVDENELRLLKWIRWFVASCFLERGNFSSWMQRCGIVEDEMLIRIPLPSSCGTNIEMTDDWLDLYENIEKTNVAHRRMVAKCHIVRHLIRLKRRMLVVFGPSGSGKTHFIGSVVGALDSERWSVHLLNLSSSTSANELLQLIICCGSLVRMRNNVYQPQNNKRVVIVLEGLSRLCHTASNSALEMLRSMFGFGHISVLSGVEGNDTLNLKTIQSVSGSGIHKNIEHLNTSIVQSIRFNEVYFIGEFTTDVLAPEHLPLPHRLLRFVLPILCENKQYDSETRHHRESRSSNPQQPITIQSYENPDNYCRNFVAAFTHSVLSIGTETETTQHVGVPNETDSSKLLHKQQHMPTPTVVLCMEMRRNINKLNQTVVPLCQKYLRSVKQLAATVNAEVEENDRRAVAPIMVGFGAESESSIIQQPLSTRVLELNVADADLQQTLKRRRLSQTALFNSAMGEYQNEENATFTHLHFTRHVAFLHKILSLRTDGHCVLVDDTDCPGASTTLPNDDRLNDAGARRICAVAAFLTGSDFVDAVGIETTDVLWRDVLRRAIRICVIERRDVTLFVADKLHDWEVFRVALCDLGIVANGGGLPTRIFTHQLLNELLEQSHRFDSASAPANSWRSGKGPSVGGISASEWNLRTRISSYLQRHLHIVVSAQSDTINSMSSEFYNFFNHSFIDVLSDWSRPEMVSYARFAMINTKIINPRPEVKKAKEKRRKNVENIGESADVKQTAEKEILSLADALVNAHRRLCANAPPSAGFSASNFLNYVRTFCYVERRKSASVDALEHRYRNGIFKLKRADMQIGHLQKELLQLQPELVRTSLETTVLMSQIERETIEIENAREVVAANEFKANEAATHAQSLKADCERDLAEAIPSLEAAIDALKIMNSADISALKTMRFPPKGVRLCMEAVCLLLGERPTRLSDGDGNSKWDYWPTGQKVLSDIHFLHRIRTFARDTVPTHVIRKIRNKYIALPDFDAEHIRESSKAAECLCLWVHAIDAYHRISRIIAPKKEKLHRAELMVKQHLKQLEIRRKALQEVTERLQRLSDQFSQMSQKKQELQQRIRACEQRMERAGKLIVALKAEHARWDAHVAQLNNETWRRRRFVMIGAAFIEYLSHADVQYRKHVAEIVLGPAVGLNNHNQTSEEERFSMRHVLEHTSSLLSEQSESVIENYAIVALSRRVPLIIDGQGESQRNIERLCSATSPPIATVGGGSITKVAVGNEASKNSNDTAITTASQQFVQVDQRSLTLYGVVVTALAMGSCLLVDNVTEPLPLILAQLISPRFVSDNGGAATAANLRMILLGAKAQPTPIAPDFRLLLRTERGAHEFSQYFIDKVCPVNIALGRRVIENNLMEIFLDVNAYQLTTKRDAYITERAQLVKQIDRLEEGLLELLSRERSTNVSVAAAIVTATTAPTDADNERAIEVLAQVQLLTERLAESRRELTQIDGQLTELRHRFADVAEHGARLVNAALALGRLSPFYARSIRYYFATFADAVAVDVTQLNSDAAHIDAINEAVRRLFLKRVMKTLFGEHRRMFEFVVTHRFDYEHFSQLSELRFFDLYTRFNVLAEHKAGTLNASAVVERGNSRQRRNSRVDAAESSGGAVGQLLNELNLRQQIQSMKSHVPLIILLSSRSNHVIRMLYRLAKQSSMLQKGSTVVVTAGGEEVTTVNGEDDKSAVKHGRKTIVGAPPPASQQQQQRHEPQLHNTGAVATALRGAQPLILGDPNAVNSTSIVSLLRHPVADGRATTTTTTAAASSSAGGGHQRRIQLIPVDDIDAFDYEQCLREDQWLVVQNCQLLSAAQLAQLEALVDGVADSSYRKLSFRMFIIMYPENGTEAPHALLDRCDVLTVDESSFTLRAFLLHCFSSLTAAHRYEAFGDGRKLLYRLCCFHFALMERSKYGIFGFASPLHCTMSELETAISLLHDLVGGGSVELMAAATITAVNVPPFRLVLKAVLEIAYLADSTVHHDRRAFSTLARWIFEGLPSPIGENAPLEPLFSFQLPATVDALRAQLLAIVRLPKSRTLSGLHSSITVYCKRAKIKQLYEKIRVLLSNRDDPAMFAAARRRPSRMAISSSSSDVVASTTATVAGGDHEEFRLLEPVPLPTGVGKAQKTGGVAGGPPAAPLSTVGCCPTIDYCIRVELHLLNEASRRGRTDRFGNGRYNHAERESYLKGLLRNRNTNRIILAYFQRPTAIFEVMKLQFAKKNNVSYNEVECYGTLRFPGGRTEDSLVELAECYLLAADFDADLCRLNEPPLTPDEAVEQHKPFTLLDTVWCVARRQRFGDPKSIVKHGSLPLYHRHVEAAATTDISADGGTDALELWRQQQGQAPSISASTSARATTGTSKKYVPILDVDIESAAHLPEIHWLLRGTKLATFLPTFDDDASNEASGDGGDL